MQDSDELVLDSFEETARRVHFSTIEISRKIQRGEFPKPVKLGKRRVAFLKHEVDAWIRQRAALRVPQPVGA